MVILVPTLSQIPPSIRHPSIRNLKTTTHLAPHESLLPRKLCHNLSFRTRPPRAGEIRNPVKAHIIRFFLDPGSRPALQDLAGMTNASRPLVVNRGFLLSYVHKRLRFSLLISRALQLEMSFRSCASCPCKEHRN